MIKDTEFANFIGIDVSKATLDICVLRFEETSFFKIKNTPKAIINWIKKEQLLTCETLVCAEFTGSYSNHVAVVFSQNGYPVWMETAIQIKKSQGFQRTKTDKTDAFKIAQYARNFQRNFTPWERPRPVIEQLKTLVNLRDKIVRNINQYLGPKGNEMFLNNPVERKILKSTYKKILKTLRAEKSSIEEQIQRFINEDEELKNLYKIVTSVQGVGFVTALELIITTNEFKTIKDPKKYACYAGVAPFEQSSGTSLKKNKVSHVANKRSKKNLHLAAMSAINAEGELKDYYLRKIGQGKSKMNALNAVRNKIIHRVYACVKRGELFVSNLNKLPLHSTQLSLE